MKKKMVSIVLALALFVTGISTDMTADTVNAAQMPADSAFFSDETVETGCDNESWEELHSEAGDLYTFNVSENGKVVGSDGVVYDDVVYLSEANVKALSADAQDAYVAFCDDVASAMSEGDCLENVVAAIDEKGTLVFYYSIPIRAIEAAIDEFADDFTKRVERDSEETLVETVQQETVQEGADYESTYIEESQKTEENQEEAAKSDEKDAVEEENTANGTIPAQSQETLTEEISLEEPSGTETTMEETSVEISMEETSVEETSVEETSMEETSIKETGSVTEEEVGSETVEPVLTAENMEFIPKLKEEHFPVTGNVKADIIMDLGYGNANSSGNKQFKSILPFANWFSRQLTDNQAVIYNASKAMGNGTNNFQFEAAGELKRKDFERAISAYIMTEPYKCDWMDLSSKGGMKIKSELKPDLTYEFQVNIVKSEFYNESLVNDANTRVLQLASQAQNYAMENYPNSLVYGIVKYFDKWICENNYYNNIGVSGGKAEDEETREIYYYCHSSYGILLKGYGVCESYALAVTRCLDAIGIPNMYATGKVPVYVSGMVGYGGHAWNYIEMPDGNWYLHDATWNDDKKTGVSTEKYLLSADDGMHIPTGNRWVEETVEEEFKNAFWFTELSSANYKPAEEVVYSEKEINLMPNQTQMFICDNAYMTDENVPKTWKSSDEKVAKVDNNGKITAVAPGTANVKFTVAGISVECTVNVHQIHSITFDNGGKSNYTTSCGMDNDKKVTQGITLTVNHKNEEFVYTAEELQAKKVFPEITAVSSKPEVATVEPILEGNTVHLVIKPLAKGKTKITIAFAGEKATLNLSVMGKQLDESMFQFEAVEALKGEKNLYTGKFYKPKIVLSEKGKEKKVRFKVNYFNNKDAGTASVVIVGSGEYGGQIMRTFQIQKMPLDVNSVKIKESNIYNGGINPTKSTVRNMNRYKEKGKDIAKKVSLKAGRDYDIFYTKTGTEDEPTLYPADVGIYKMKIVGKNNYEGEYEIPGEYQIKANDIKKVKVSVKVNGTIPTVSVAIGKNPLPQTDYKITYYTDKKCEKEKEIDSAAFLPKKQYFVKVEAAGPNLTDIRNKPIVKSFKTK